MDLYHGFYRQIIYILVLASRKMHYEFCYSNVAEKWRLAFNPGFYFILLALVIVFSDVLGQMNSVSRLGSVVRGTHPVSDGCIGQRVSPLRKQLTTQLFVKINRVNII